MYKLLFWEFDGSQSTVTGEMEDLKHLIGYLDASVYWQIVQNSVVIEQSEHITADCFRGCCVVVRLSVFEQNLALKTFINGSQPFVSTHRATPD